MVMRAPPPTTPVLGTIERMEDDAYENALGNVDVRLGVVTVRLTEPAACAGVTAVIIVDETTIMFVAGAPPIVTLVAPVKYAPEIVMGVPPTIVP